MFKMIFFYILVVLAVAHAQTSQRDTFVLKPISQTIVRPAKINRVVQPIIQDVVQPVVRQKTFQTIVRPAKINRVVQPIIQDVVQPVVRQKTFQTIVRPVRTENRVAESVVRPITVLRNKFIKRSVGVAGSLSLNGTMQPALPFLGEWEFVSSDENFEALMKELGVGWFTRKIALTQSPSVRFELNGEEWTFTTTSAFKTTVLKFTIGKEFDEETADGRDVKTTFSFDDGKLVQTQKFDGKVVCVIVREVLNGNKLKTLAKAGSIESVRMYSKI